MCGHSSPQAHRDRVPGGPRFWRNDRVGLSFLVNTISKNALAGNKSHFLELREQSQ